MRIYTKYSAKIKNHNHIFDETVKIYRRAVDYIINVCLKEWNSICPLESNKKRNRIVEHMIHKTPDKPKPAYDFDEHFPGLPAYLRRAAIADALGMTSSYMNNLARWKEDPKGNPPKLKSCGYAYPTLYRNDMFKQTGDYTARIKVCINNTWTWLDIELRKSDMDYIRRRCSTRRHCAPRLQKRGKEWSLDFPFEEKVKLCDIPLHEQKIAAVDLGINNAATVCIMMSDGTILGRHFLKLPKEADSFNTAINRTRKAQSLGAKHMPRLWAKVKGINENIAIKTAQFIIDVAAMYNADVIVLEHLDLNGKNQGSKRQHLHLWKAKYVQAMVTDKAHRLGMRISRVNACNTSRLAFDGSGPVKRGRESGRNDNNYSLCEFASGKLYNCDLNASLNIGARYFIREILKSLPETVRLLLEAKVPSVSKRSTCTLSDLISLNAELRRL